MRNFHSKSIILGMGLGMILISIVSIIYLAGVNPRKTMSQEQIIKEAEKLGMVRKNMGTPEPARTLSPSPTETSAPTSTSTPTPELTLASSPAPIVSAQPIPVEIDREETGSVNNSVY